MSLFQKIDPLNIDDGPGMQVPTHPWRRWFARMIDVTAVAFVVIALLSFVLAVVAPEWLDGRLAALDSLGLYTNVAYGLIAFAIAWPVIACLLTLCGTPGKWLCGIKVVRIADGERPTLGESLLREAMVWSRGLALGIPLLSLLTQLRAHTYLEEHGHAAWDRRLGLRVEHAPMTSFGWVKLVFAGAVALGIQCWDWIERLVS
jgi:uncharacterized RDD family membrane protein YckC